LLKSFKSPELSSLVMAKIAIDIALLPPEEIMDKAIEINRSFESDPIRLNKKNCLPHISLFMGVVDEEELGRVSEIVERVASGFSALDLEISKLGNERCWFDIKKSSELQKLHERVMADLDPYLTKSATSTMFISSSEISESTFFWVNNFKDKLSFENYYPHITLGKTKIAKKVVDIKFQASKVAICHMGNNGTCRKVLYLVELSK